jgi:hypothetical protein
VREGERTVGGLSTFQANHVLHIIHRKASFRLWAGFIHHASFVAYVQNVDGKAIFGGYRPKPASSTKISSEASILRSGGRFFLRMATSNMWDTNKQRK